MAMRACFAVLLLAWPACAEIRDVLRSAEIDAMFAQMRRELVAHQRPNFAILFRASEDGPGYREANPGADEVWFLRRGRAKLVLGERRYEIGAGDVVHVPRRTSWQLEAGRERLEYVAVRVFPEGEQAPPALGGILAPRRMPDVVKKSEIDTTFSSSSTNQPLHAGRNFTLNYVIYKGRSGPWEAHRGCVDIYFLHHGTSVAQLGGEISRPQEETPGEIRGNGMSGARMYRIGPGDIVVIPRNTAHHMDPESGSLGYLLVKVWAE